MTTAEWVLAELEAVRKALDHYATPDADVPQAGGGASRAAVALTPPRPASGPPCD